MDEPEPTEPRVEEPTAKRPYLRPRLRHLGSVRELTAGGSNGRAEGAGTFRSML